jgi:hypothetical protein
MPHPTDASHPEIELTGSQRATIDSLLGGEEPIRPPNWLARQAAINYETERAWAGRR